MCCRNRKLPSLILGVPAPKRPANPSDLASSAPWSSCMLICVEAIRRGLVPPSLNCEQPEEGLGINVVRGGPLKTPVEVALTNSFGFGGHNASLVVGPPPVLWDEVNERIAARAEAIAAVCAEAAVPFVPTFDALRSGGAWMREVAEGDGAHPGPDGYAQFADVISRPVLDWLRELPDTEPG